MLGSGPRLLDRLRAVSALPPLAVAHLALSAVAGITFFAAPVAFLRPPPQAAAAVKISHHIYRLVGSGPMLERDIVLDLAHFLEPTRSRVSAYERLVAQAYEQALADAGVAALPVLAVER